MSTRKVQAGAALPVALVNSNDESMAKLYDYALVTIDFPHYQQHLGQMFEVSYKSADGGDLSDNATINFLLTVGDIPCHLIFEANCGGDAEILLREKPTPSGAGTAVTPVCHNRNYPKVSTMTVARSVPYTGGTLLHNALLPGGTGGNAGGGSTRREEEFLLRTNTQYLLEVINRAGGAKPASLVAAWYEHA